MSAGVSHVGFYYMNGIANTDESGSGATDVVQKIIQTAPNFEQDKTFVSFEHNDSAPTERLLMEITIGIGGAVAVTHSLNKESKKQGDSASKFIGVAGACAIVGALYDYAKMQEQKNEIAETLAGRVSRFLDEHELNIANLIFHSQGADVGYRSLELLSKYKERIRVVTLGAMTTIPNSMCAQVTNYKFRNDWISKLLALPFEITRESTDDMGQRDIILLEKEGALAHGISDYLKEELVQDSLKNLL